MRIYQALLTFLPLLVRAADVPVAVLISANAEWRAVKPLYKDAPLEKSPYGEYFFANVQRTRVLFFQGGWGKIAAAASTQYVIDRFHPGRLINLGTCGGVEGRIERFAIVAPEKVVVYDIAEAMGDSQEAIAHYSTALALPPKLPAGVRKLTMYSADRDLTTEGLREIDSRLHPVVVDWESGSIAWVASRNHTPLLIVRGVSDLVSFEKAEAQGNLPLFAENAARVMQKLVGDLPAWIGAFR
jgi:adenosylhomocysteine nucleosidase